MGNLKNYDKLLKFMYDEFNRGRNDSGYGERIQVLIAHFEGSSPDNRIGDASEQIGAVRYFLDRGLIDAADIYGNRITYPSTAYARGRMQPTQNGLNYLQEKRLGAANAAASVSGTFLGRFLKSLLGK